MERLKITNFAHLADVDIEFGDLTVLVGAQGTGKSLALQWLKTALDGKHIVRALQDAGQDVSKTNLLVDLVFGVGMGEAWHEGKTEITFRGNRITPKNMGKLGADDERCSYIPAHRAMLISNGWASPFSRLDAQTPVVARLFSQSLFDLFSPHAEDKPLFPMGRKLKTEYRDLIEASIFHGGTVGLATDAQHARKLQLTHGTSRLPFMTWTAGQREFTPLLLGLYHLLPERKHRKQENIEWVIIEEPEMGLHPQAVTAFMALVLDLLWRPYKVVIATHSPLVLTAVWMLRNLSALGARWQLVCDGFGLPTSSTVKQVAKAALEKSYKTYVLEFQGRTINAKDISSLDPSDADESVAGWGGLTGFGSRFSDAVATAVNEAESRR
ncbi:MAG: AAA family ATPase [Sandaracinus sp.]